MAIIPYREIDFWVFLLLKFLSYQYIPILKFGWCMSQTCLFHIFKFITFDQYTYTGASYFCKSLMNEIGIRQPQRVLSLAYLFLPVFFIVRFRVRG